VDERLRLEDAVSLDDRGFIETDDSFRTTTDGVYAVDDVSGPPMFTRSARNSRRWRSQAIVARLESVHHVGDISPENCSLGHR